MKYVAPTPARPIAPPKAIRVFVAEDHKITLWGLQNLIGASAHMQLVGTASSRSELLNHDAAAEADVILLDLDLGGEDSSESLADLRRRCSGRVLVLTAAEDVRQHRAAVVRGARGVLHKSEPAETILLAIEKVHEGEVWLHRSLFGEVLSALTGGAPQASGPDPHAQRIASLTPRERDIVSAMATSPGVKQLAIADELGMSDHTLRNHLTTIYSKLCVHGRLELYVYATEHGLCRPDADPAKP
jgi:DNA-binding NarL/FixJ family response regulator